MPRPFNALQTLNRLHYYAEDELQYHLNQLSVDELVMLSNHRWAGARIVKEVTKLIANKKNDDEPSEPAPIPN
jgi:hypothetical protein